MKYVSLTLPGPDLTPTQEISDPTGLSGHAGALQGIISFVITLLATIGIIAAVIFLIWGGITWTTSGGDKEKLDHAKKMITYSIIGLVVIILSFVILNFIKSLLGAS